LPTDRVRRDQKYLPSWKALLPEPWDSFNRFAAVLVLPRKIWAIFWGNFHGIWYANLKDGGHTRDSQSDAP
jgi:hypothetical protein